MSRDPIDDLLEADLAALRALEPEDGPAERVRTALLDQEAAVDHALNDFAQARPIDPTWLDEAPSGPRWNRLWPAIPLALAAAAVFAVAVWPKPGPTPPPGADTGAATAVVGLEDCGGGRTLEAGAIERTLTDEQLECLRSVSEAEDRDAASRILMAYLWHVDREAWEDQLRVHLEEIDSSDPDLTYKAALHFAKKKDMPAAALWSSKALEMAPDSWKASHRSGAHRIHTYALQQQWDEAEQAAARGLIEPAERDRAREATGDAARAWLDWEVSIGGKTTMAWQLCVTAKRDEALCPK